MKCLVKAKPEEGIWMEHRPVPEIRGDEVLIKIRKTAICGTDVHIYNWDGWAAENVPVGLITGHEYSGEIVDVGKHAQHLKVGQYVTGEGHVIGQFSRNARAGRFHLAPDTQALAKFFAEHMGLRVNPRVRIPVLRTALQPPEVPDEDTEDVDTDADVKAPPLPSIDFGGDRPEVKLAD